MTRPHLAALAEDGLNLVRGAVLRHRGWRHVVVDHTGYGGEDFLRVLARVVYAPEPDDDTPRGEERHDQQLGRRGWQNFLTAEAPGVEVSITVGGHRHLARTDRSGILDVRVPNPGLGPGRQEVEVSAELSRPTPVPVLVVSAEEEFGIVSDIDDTVIRTYLPRPLVAAYNALVVSEGARKAVPGMAQMYAALLAEHPGAPTVYLSTGAWNTARPLTRFLARHGFPSGPLLMTDWGPTNTGWFRSGQEHKRAALAALATDFPRIRWLLVGDDGQHDPVLYAEFAAAHPDRVRAIAIRQLGTDEHVLSHGTPTTRHEDAGPGSAPRVADVRAPDGETLLPLVRAVL